MEVYQIIWITSNPNIEQVVTQLYCDDYHKLDEAVFKKILLLIIIDLNLFTNRFRSA